MENVSMSCSPLLFVGLDSAEPELLREWSDSGELPHLRSLIERGLWGETGPFGGFGNGAFWPNFFTGTNPAKHGRYYRRQIRTGSYRIEPFCEDTDFKAEPIWTLLSRAGRRVAVIDMVRAGRFGDCNGLHLVDWLTHDPSGPTRAHPEEVASEVLARYGDNSWEDRHGLATHDPAARSAGYYEALSRGLVERVEQKTRMSRDYLAKDDWDVFMTVYADPHDIGHQCWHLHDRGHPDYDASKAAEVGDPIKRVYQAIDRGIGELLEQAGPDATVMVFGGPGMGPGYSANVILDEILDRLDARESRDGRRLDRIRALYRTHVPGWVRKRVRVGAYRLEDSMRATVRRDGRAFALQHNSNAGAVRINLQGREPEGRVRPEDYDAVCDELAEGLRELRNLDTGKRVVDQVVRVHRVCRGDHVQDLPDLLAVWNREAAIDVVGSPAVGEIPIPYYSRRTGDHTPRGFFTLCGPGIAPGALEAKVSVQDVAATLTGLAGVEIPDGDGAPIPQAERR